MSSWCMAAIQRSDLEPILEIEQHSFRWPWSRLSFENELSCPNAFNFLVKSDDETAAGQIVAYAFLRLIADELHILKIAVAQTQRKQGIASWLMTRCFRIAAKSGATSVFLEVRPSNVAAVGLYQKLGFTIIGRRPNYYAESKEDALVMAKNLKEDI